MAELRQVEVVFKVGAAETKKASENIRKPKTNKVQDEESEDAAFRNIAQNQAWNYVKADIRQIVGYEINKWFTLTDDYIGQRNVTAAMNVINKAKSIGVTLAAGFMAAGPIGLIVAAVGSAIDLGVGVSQNYDRQNIRIKQMNAQLEYQRQRAGYSLTSGRVGENK